MISRWVDWSAATVKCSIVAPFVIIGTVCPMLEDDETTCFARINRQTDIIKNEYSYGQMKSWHGF